MATATPTLDTVSTALLNLLSAFLPAPIAGIPAPSAIMTNLHERSAGLGRHLGTSSVAGFDVIALKGIRLEGVVRFQIWGAAPADVDTAIASLNSRLLAARDPLWGQGVLKINMRDAKPSEHIQDVGWRRSADYRVLYEFPYHDSDDAESLLVRVPIAIDSNFNESMLVTDRMTRWDDLIAPSLRVRGPLQLNFLSALSFIPGAQPTGVVTLTRTFDGAQGLPAAHATMPTFLNAVGGDPPAEKHAAVTFPSVNVFLAAMTPDGAPVVLGDWNQDGIPDQYQALGLNLQPSIRLAGAADRFEITYATPAFDNVAVLYLRLAQRTAT